MLFYASTFSLLAAWACPQMCLAAETAESIVRKADDARSPQEDFSATVKVVDAQKADKKESSFRVFSKGNHFALVNQTAPDRQVGRKLLMHDHNLWLFNPNIGRPTRISFEQKLTGEVANGDLMRTNFAEDYTPTLKGEESIEGVQTYHLTLEAKSKDVTYKSIDYWVTKDKLYPHKALFHALSGKGLKTALFSEFKPVLGKSRTTKVVITDAIETGRTSTIQYTSFKKETLSESFFNKDHLEQ